MYVRHGVLDIYIYARVSEMVKCTSSWPGFSPSLDRLLCTSNFSQKRHQRLGTRHMIAFSAPEQQLPVVSGKRNNVVALEMPALLISSLLSFPTLLHNLAFLWTQHLNIMISTFCTSILSPVPWLDIVVTVWRATEMARARIAPSSPQVAGLSSALRLTAVFTFCPQLQSRHIHHNPRSPLVAQHEWRAKRTSVGAVQQRTQCL